MKTIAIVLMWISVQPLIAQTSATMKPFDGPSFRDTVTQGAAAAEQIKSERDAKLSEDAWQKYMRDFVPRQPWRDFDGVTNYVLGIGVEFAGKVKQVVADGIIINGEYGPIFSTDYSDSNRYKYPDFLVENYPFNVADDYAFSSDRHLMAKLSGVYTYETSGGATRTINKLDYGTPCAAPGWYLNQISAAQDAAQRTARIKLQKSFITLSMMATNGDPGAQYSLGIRYLKGSGCETNLEQAVYWLTKSAGQGDIEASNKLATLK